MIRIIIFLFAILVVTAGYCQSVNSLKEQIKLAEQEIKINNELLAKNQKTQKLTQTQLKLIQARIKSRQEIVGSMQGQIELINKDISSKNSSVEQMNGRLARLKKEYAQMIYSSYKDYKTNNYLSFLFSSRDFNQATRRMDYINRYNEMCKKKVVQIDSLTKNISTQISDLDRQRAELDQAKLLKNKEVETLGKDEKEYKTSVQTLTATQSKLQKKVREKQDQITRAQQQIQNIIAQEAKKSKTETKTVAQQQYDTKLSGEFGQNIGRLPYPVIGGVIIDGYGVHAHPTIAGLKVNNKGINIAVAKGTQVKSVFEGVVTRIFFFQGLNNSVMVRHGNYITVYSNLETVSVKTGDKVVLAQVLGSVSTGNDPEEYMVHFEIWNESTNLNPGLWLRR